MAASARELRPKLESVSRALLGLHRRILDAEGLDIPALQGVALLDRLLNDPAWAWLRALSKLITDIDEALAQDTELTDPQAAAMASRVRALVFGQGESRDEEFLRRYRPLLQRSAALASAHGELKRQVDSLPAPGPTSRNGKGAMHG